jgi:hypothetical protein
MTWRQRLRPTIKFVSPEGNEFEAFWQQSDHNIDKKLGIFDYPLVRGTVVQDLEASSDRYSIPFGFAGQDHDQEAFRFILSCRERGQWSVTHPTEGFLGLQLISITKLDRPIAEGNITRFNSEWVEPIDETSLQTASELAGLVGNRFNDLNIGAADQFLKNLRSQTASQLFSIQQAVSKVTTAVNKVLGPVAAFNDAVFSAQLAIQRGIQETLTATIFEPLSLAGQLQNLIQLPGRAIQDIGSRLSSYGTLAAELFGLSPEQPTVDGRNTVAVQELSLSAIVGSNAEIAVTGPSQPDTPAEGGLQSRAQVIEIAEDLRNRFLGITENLDLTQKLFNDIDIDLQYFSQSETFNIALQLTTTAQQYMLLAAYDLSVERRFTLEKPKTPLQIVGEEYGSFGAQNDDLIDLFISSNKLRGTEILFLPAGREILVYA